MWVPDVYQGAPTSVTLFISSAPKIAAFAVTARILVDGLFPLIEDWQSWYKKESAIFANLKAFLVNRIGDFGFALGIVGIYFIFGSIDFQVIFDNAYLYKEKNCTIY